MPISFKGGLVLIDRYYFDFFVDQKRYRLKVPLWLVRVGYLFVKKPDLVLLLDAPAEVLQARKQEVAFFETQRQCGAYRDVIGELDNGRVIDATQEPEKVAKDIVSTVLEFMTARCSKRLRKAASSGRSGAENKTVVPSGPC